jgi:hypothetical protein
VLSDNYISPSTSIRRAPDSDSFPTAARLVRGRS